MAVQRTLGQTRIRSSADLGRRQPSTCFCALTFNGHRIHYDRPYATQVEGYPGLVVHGPLIATLLMDLVRRHAPGADVATFKFRAVHPTFDLHPFRVNGKREGHAVKLWAQDHEGWLTMDAVATLR
jgi:3-methylfumaryl-CoA hydratase